MYFVSFIGIVGLSENVYKYFLLHKSALKYSFMSRQKIINCIMVFTCREAVNIFSLFQ